jgi:hypothetical protein
MRAMPSTAYPPNIFTLLSNGHNFYMPTSNEEIFTSLEITHQHLDFHKISKPTKD